MKSIITCICLFLVTAVSASESFCQKQVNRLQMEFMRYIEAQEPTAEILAFGANVVNDVMKVNTEFVLRRNIDVAQARRLFILYMEQFLAIVNKDSKLRPFLHNFTIDNHYLSLSFLNPYKNDYVPSPHIAFVFIRDQKIIFQIKNPQTHELEIIHSELYVDASKIVQSAEAQIRYSGK